MKSVLIVLALLLGTFAPRVHSQILAEYLSVHPAQVARNESFLVLVEDQWRWGCGGTVSVSVTAAVIDVLAIPANSLPGVFCAAVLGASYQVLINPRDHVAANFEFASQVTIRYRRAIGPGIEPELIQAQPLVFGAGGNRAHRIENGSWVTPALESSGLFIDQQGGLLSASLMEYDNDSSSMWAFAAGTVNGNTFSSTMSTYSEIQCVTSPCPRASPNRTGRINILLRNATEIVVGYSGVLRSPRGLEGSAFSYKRFDFERSPELAQAESEGLVLPDLIGSWAGGIVGDLFHADDVRAVSIGLAGRDESSFNAYRFVVFPNAGIGNPSIFPVPILYHIVCEDARAVDGPIACHLRDYQYAGGSCESSFAFAAVGQESLSAAATCRVGSSSFDTTFRLFKLD